MTQPPVLEALILATALFSRAWWVLIFLIVKINFSLCVVVLSLK